jgi:biofilm PGA synthesis N-glycosyltransferase PgaC
MIHDIFVYFIAFASLISMIHLGFFIVGANTYDIMQFKKSRQKRMLAAKPIKRKKLVGGHPLVSVIIPAHNEETGVIRTLDSVRRSTYPNVEIIVVNDGSKDRTVAVVDKYIKRPPRLKELKYLSRSGRNGRLQRSELQVPVTDYAITLISQTNKGKGAAVNNGIEHAKGQFVMTLDADSLLDSRAIENTVAHFKDKRVLGVAANVRIMGDNSWISLLQRFEHIIGYRSKKFYSLTGTEFIVGGVASTYRRTTLKKVGMYDTDTMTEDIGLSLKILAKEGNKNKRIIYAADVVAMTEGVHTYKQLIRQRYRWKMGMLQNLYKFRSLLRNNQPSKYSLALTAYRLPMAVLSEILLIFSPFALMYIIAISISYQTLGILFGAYLTITAYVLWNIWPDEYLTLRQKLKMSLFATFMYFIFYAMDLVQVIAIARCLRNFDNVIRLTQGHVTWISPTRAVKSVPATV